eukprot:3473312-Rhodomonas_salina.1
MPEDICTECGSIVVLSAGVCLYQRVMTIHSTLAARYVQRKAGTEPYPPIRCPVLMCGTQTLSSYPMSGTNVRYSDPILLGYV